MVTEMSTRLPTYEGLAYRVRCFDHVIHLIAISFTRLFEVKEKHAKDGDEGEASLQALASGLDIEELMEQITWYRGGRGTEDDDDLTGWVDEIATLSEEEKEKLGANLRPAKMVLVKVVVSLSGELERVE